MIIFFDTFNKETLEANLDPNNNYFQTPEITRLIYNYLREKEVKENIINHNPFQSRYDKNNDCFIHVRLTDVAHKNPGIDYWFTVLSQIKFDNLYIASDDFNHVIVRQIIEKYPNSFTVSSNPIETIQFGSTCKHICLSHGSYSAIIGWLAFYSNVYYKDYTDFDKSVIWFGDMFCIKDWNIVS